MDVTPIGVFRCRETYAYDAARQGVLADENPGVVELAGGQNFEQALQDLEGFSHIWLLFQFHKNTCWKPIVRPPRGNKKVGVFASRAPYRPNAIGMSCVRLVGIQGLRVEVSGHDLLDGTPIVDIKPYIPYADCFPEATGGWTDALENESWAVTFSEPAREQLVWLTAHGVGAIEGFLVQQLAQEPLDTTRKRLRHVDDVVWEIAYRTWRVRFESNAADRRLTVVSVHSGYDHEEVVGEGDPYEDKAVHRAFVAVYG
jgi:tRNA (adenine37-N6)-methyltransferase